jgi:exonuclease III
MAARSTDMINGPKIKIGSWNIRGNYRSDEEKVLLVKEINEHHMDVVCLQETRQNDETLKIYGEKGSLYNVQVSKDRDSVGNRE